MAEHVLADDARPGDSPAREVEIRLARHRVELVGYCYRMLGSAFVAEDAVQETLLRAWRSYDRFDERRSAWRSWLFTIATNVCFDMLRSAQRRGRAVELVPACGGGEPDFGSPLPDDRWIGPVPDRLVVPEDGDPAELTTLRETIRLAFVAALQHLPPRQRAVLILRDVLGWKAAEVAQLLACTVTSVNSALQRARARLDALRPAPTDPFRPMDVAQERLLRRYCEAFERHDMTTLVALLHEDATMSMPPLGWWLRGRSEIHRLLTSGDGCRGDRLVPTVANGSPAFGQYRLGDGRHEPFALVVLELAGGWIVETTSYLDAARLFPLFGLPADLRR